MGQIALPRCLREQRLIIVDVETTGFRPNDRIIEVGIMWIEDGEIVMELSQLCNPKMDLPDVITDLTGISQGEVNRAEPFSVIADFLIDTLAEPSVLMAFNHSFDFRFLRKEMEWCGKELCLSKDVIDPLPWLRVEDKGKSCKLTDAAQRRGVTVKDAHRALADCRMTAGLLNTLKMPDTLDEALSQQRSLGSGKVRR